jgi:hypothetical protein
LDPAGPYFELTDPRVRLDETDALFVDVIHTDAAPSYYAGLGIMQPSGHVDFYPNGGQEQPKCASTTQKIVQGLLNIANFDIEGLEKSTVCSHLLSVNVFLDSIINQNCKYTSFPCKSIEDFNLGKCLKCGSTGCNQMGFWASSRRDVGSLYLKTQAADEYPYCQHHYQITLNSNNLSKQIQTRGKVLIRINGELSSSLFLQITDSDFTFKPGEAYVQLVETTKPLGDKIKSILLQFYKTTTLLSSFLYQNNWSFKYIEIYNGGLQNYQKFCPEFEYVENGNTLLFTSC